MRSLIIVLLPFVMMLGACAKQVEIVKEPYTVERVVTRTVPVKTPKPQVPSVDTLDLRDVQWKIVTPDNIDEVFAAMKARGEEPVLFAITTNGYENLSLNMSDLRASIAQHQRVIAVYEDSYE
jgi:hypothetical protein